MTPLARSAAGPSATGWRPSFAWMKVLAAAPLSAKLGLFIVASYVAVAISAPWVSPYGEAEIVGSQFEPWSARFLLGTDNLGRDMLTRLVYGARNTVGIAFASTLLAFAVGGVLGIFSAVAGGWPDHLLSRAIDVLMAIPQLIFSMFLLTIFGMSVPVLIAVIALVDSTRVFRLARALAMNVVTMDYIDVARLRGESRLWIMRREILPNILSPLVAEFGLRFCFVFLMISALSFLGLGIQPPTADWGSMVRDNATLITYGDVTPLLPAGAIAVLTIGINYLIDWFLDKSSGLREGQ
ncbi:ABC transporter permease [Shinella curvata]